MPSWVIGIPIWGPKYVKIFADYAAPALRAALRGCPDPVRILIHTDMPNEVRAALTIVGGLPGMASTVSIETFPVPTQPTYVTLQKSHADVIARAKVGDWVVLLNADLVISGNLLRACEARFMKGAKAIVTAGIRTKFGDGAPPVGAEPRALLVWAWDHRHQIIRDLEWGKGGSMLPTNLFFTNGDSVVLRGFHLHPVAILKEKELSFISTIDGDLLEHFPRETIHVVTDPDELSMLEISPLDKRFPVRSGIMNPARVAASMKSRASALHKWLFTHRIVIKGTGEGCGDDAVTAAVLSLLGVRAR